jgi:hypothetical protein
MWLAPGQDQSAAWECQPDAVQREVTRLRTRLAGVRNRCERYRPRLATSEPRGSAGSPRTGRPRPAIARRG